ncbi:NADPH-dependent FMN reductase [Streptococcus zalophi]|uniref:NAD(P)H-dependent oxidoreductase n=1 Tax=Streptococcus zalophi TaxID=640031 RepID=A0A934PA22_9STRE|nr:NADPH-dependent FMN reductase [Streptococcus zalophi]MBJ8349839.1 NAD(P)H-dependent oxidoreductase [Streptococcus zalophi]MCR8967607.1 NAD(P)H-dependent oxidoreductase [Streptococcus zalophi]
MSKKILFIVGSLRKESFNHQLAKEAEALLSGKAEVSYLDFSEVPVFNQDLESPVLPAVAKVREEIQAADAIWIFSPIYNFAVPGAVKNLLDWVSRALDLSDPTGPSAINQKVVTVSSVGNGGHEPLFAEYSKMLSFIRTTVVGDFTASKVNPEAWQTGKLEVAEDVKENLKKQADVLLEAIN